MNLRLSLKRRRAISLDSLSNLEKVVAKNVLSWFGFVQAYESHSGYLL